MNSVTGSTQNGLLHDHWWLTAWVLDKNHNRTKDKLGKTTAKLQQIHLYFWLVFALLHQGIVITVTFKMLPTCLLKRQSKRYTKIKFCHSNNSNGKDLTVLFKMGLWRDINKLSLISKSFY